MSNTLNYRKQHEEILQIMQIIFDYLENREISSTAREIRGLLAKLSGKIKIHLTIEDESLYPRLLNHHEANIKSLALNYASEMGGLKQQFNAYIKNWPHSQSIQENPDKFTKETTQILNALKERIAKEDNELYYIYDRLA